MEKNKWKAINKRPFFKGPPVLCPWPSALRPYPSVAQLVKNKLEKFAKEQQLALSNNNRETSLNVTNKPETQRTIEPESKPELPQSDSQVSQSNPQLNQSNPQPSQSTAQPPQPNAQLPESTPQRPQSNPKLSQSSSQQPHSTNSHPSNSNPIFPESNPPLPQSTSTHFFHFLRLMQMFPETHPATLHTVLTMSGNKFFVAIDKLLYAQRSRNDMMNKTVRSNVSVMREREANLFSSRGHSNRGRPPKTQKYGPCSVSNNHLSDVLGSKNNYLFQTSTFKNQKRPINNNDNSNQMGSCVQIQDNDILELYYNPTLNEETFEGLIENEDQSLNEENFKGFIENEDVLMNANEEHDPDVILVDISEGE